MTDVLLVMFWVGIYVLKKETKLSNMKLEYEILD